MDLTWHSPSDPEQHPTLELRRDWDTSWGAARLSGGVPYLPHGALLDRTWNSRDVRRWVRAPLKQSHCTLLSLGALTAPHSTRSSVNAGLLAQRSRSHFLCLDCLDLKVRLVHAGNLSRLRARGGLRSIRTKFSAHAKIRFSNCLTTRSLASFDARQRTCDRRNRKRINRPRIALWDQRWIHPAPGTSRSALARKNSSSSVL
jgi:hypothetical protein